MVLRAVICPAFSRGLKHRFLHPVTQPIVSKQWRHWAPWPPYWILLELYRNCIKLGVFQIGQFSDVIGTSLQPTDVATVISKRQFSHKILASVIKGGRPSGHCHTLTHSRCSAICAKVAPRLCYLKQLRRAGLPSGDLLYFYLTAIRPVLEYGCVVWHHGLTVAQSPKLESLQKRALRIIHQIVYDMPYDLVCEYVGVQSLSAQRSDLGRRFFRSVTVSDSCLHDPLPQQRDSEILSRLRQHTVYPMPGTKTNKYRSFIHYALAKYQWSNKII